MTDCMIAQTDAARNGFKMLAKHVCLSRLIPYFLVFVLTLDLIIVVQKQKITSKHNVLC